MLIVNKIKSSILKKICQLKYFVVVFFFFSHLTTLRVVELSIKDIMGWRRRQGGIFSISGFITGMLSECYTQQAVPHFSK